MEKKVSLQRVSFEMTIDGVAHKVIKPNMRMIKEFTKEQRALEKSLKDGNEDSDYLAHTVVFLGKLGLPENVVTGLDPEMIEQVLNIVMGEKKS